MGFGIEGAIVGEVRMWAGGGAGSNNILTPSNPSTVQIPVAGWLFCNGAVFANATYPDLAGVLGTAFNTGGEGAGNTRLPNLQSKFPLGRSFSAPGATIAETSGTISETLTIAQIPLHSHSGTTGFNDRDHSHAAGGLFIGANIANGPSGFQPYVGSGYQSFFFTTGGTTGLAGGTGGESTPHLHSFSTDTGSGLGGGSHNNMPPYLTVNYLIKF